MSVSDTTPSLVRRGMTDARAGLDRTGRGVDLAQTTLIMFPSPSLIPRSIYVSQ